MRITLDAHGQPIAGFNLCDVFTFLVHQEVGDDDRRLDQDFF